MRQLKATFDRDVVKQTKAYVEAKAKIEGLLELVPEDLMKHFTQTITSAKAFSKQLQLECDPATDGLAQGFYNDICKWLRGELL